MDTPLYKLFLFKRTPTYLGLPAERLASLRDRMIRRQKDLGILNLFNAAMAWSNERYEFFGVEYFPSLKAVQEYTRCLNELHFFQLVEGESFLGIPMDANYPNFEVLSSDPADDDEEETQEPVYRVYFSRVRPAQPQIQNMLLSEGSPFTEQDELSQLYELSNESLLRAGAKPLLSAYARWNNEEWDYFGIERFPNLQALIGHSQLLSTNGWYRHIQARSYLGTAYGGIIWDGGA